MLCEPRLTLLIAKDATPVFNVTVPSAVLPSVNVTVPAGERPVTVAVRVTGLPSLDGFGDIPKVVVVAASVTVSVNVADALGSFFASPL